MAKQLIFCSVPHGLQPGRSGYCLMAGHTDIPQSLIRQLEQETSVFPEFENEDHAPWHEIRKIGDTHWHLFIRQTTGIRDYTGRSSGLTHVIAEREKDLPDGLDPKTVLWSFKRWVTGIPAKPVVFGDREEIHLGGIPTTQSAPPAQVLKATSPYQNEGFRVNTKARPKKPAPRPRSGIYYDGKPRRSSKRWWLGFGLFALIIVIILVL